MEILRMIFNIGSPVLGCLGTVLVFFFGIPPRLDSEGHVYIVANQKDETEKKKARRYDRIGKIGLLLIALSFLSQLIAYFIK
jgi:hypothetical protein